jgi:hypothetical protein
MFLVDARLMFRPSIHAIRSWLVGSGDSSSFLSSSTAKRRPWSKPQPTDCTFTDNLCFRPAVTSSSYSRAFPSTLAHALLLMLSPSHVLNIFDSFFCLVMCMFAMTRLACHYQSVLSRYARLGVRVADVSPCPQCNLRLTGTISRWYQTCSISITCPVPQLWNAVESLYIRGATDVERSVAADIQKRAAEAAAAKAAKKK